jgi:hypothetical protein
VARPAFDLTDEHVRNIRVLAGYGLSLAQIAAVIGINERTLTRHKSTEIRVASALERGRAEAQATIGRSLFERARDGDVAAIRWWEMTRAGRTQAVRQINEGVPQSPVTIVLPDWTALIREKNADAA